ncbi:hypothetical protein J7L68_06285 [bacterium]|nr:hypothetical protein [bacterium]
MMKKLLLIAMISLLAVCLWGQDLTEKGNPSDANISIHVKMIGLSWTLDTLDDGALSVNTATMGTWIAAPAATPRTYTSTMADADSLQPCDIMGGAFWAENVGGLTLDMTVSGAITDPGAGDPWSIWTDITCASAYTGAANHGRDQSVVLVDFTDATAADAFAFTNTATSNIPGVADEVDNATFVDGANAPASAVAAGLHLPAEDIANVGDDDGIAAGENDITNIYVAWIAPPNTAIANLDQILTVTFTAKIAD